MKTHGWHTTHWPHCASSSNLLAYRPHLTSYHTQGCFQLLSPFCKCKVSRVGHVLHRVTSSPHLHHTTLSLHTTKLMWKIEFPRGKLSFPRSQSGLVLKARLTVNTFVNHHGDNLTGRTHTPFPALITAKKEVWASELSRWVFTPFLPFSSLRLTTLSTHKQAILTISLRPLRREELQTTSSKKMI